MVCADVLQNLRWYKCGRRGVVVQPFANLGGSGRISKNGDCLDACSLFCGQSESFQLIKIEAGSAHDNPSRLLQEFLRVFPLSYAEERVGPNDDKGFRARLQFGAQSTQCVDGVVRSAVGLRAVDRRHFDSFGSIAEQFHHAEAIGEGSMGSVGFQGLDCRWCEKDAVECELVTHRCCYGEMASMRWVKAAAE